MAYLLLLFEHRIRIAKYIISGGTAASVNLGFLFLFADVLGLHYLVAGVLAFVLAFGVSFTLQKFWTFQNHDRALIPKQMVIYLTVSVFSLMVNTILLYLFVEWFGWWHIWAQVMAGGLLALINFFIYRFVIFHQPIIELS